MKIEVIIDDDMLDEPVRKAVAAAVNIEVRNKVNEIIYKYKDRIEEAINVYLAKKLTDDKIKSMIDKETVALMAERIRDLS